MSEKLIVIIDYVDVESKHSLKHEVHTHSISNEKKILAGIAAATLLVGGIAIGNYAAAETPKSTKTTVVSEVAPRQEAVPQQTEIELAQSKANSIADAINKTINNSGPVVMTPVLNGKIIRNVFGAPLYENAYLLYTPYNQQPDTAGNFLKGAWIGLSNEVVSSSIAISPVKFDSDTMVFVANHNGDPVIDVGIMATPVNNLSGHAAYEASVVSGPAGKQNPQNNDGSPITPGLRIGK